jgi:hypothetical protein
MDVLGVKQDVLDATADAPVAAKAGVPAGVIVGVPVDALNLVWAYIAKTLV